MSFLSQDSEENLTDCEMEAKLQELYEKGKRILGIEEGNDQLSDSEDECEFVSEEEFEAKWTQLRDFTLKYLEQNYSNAAEFTEKFKERAEKMKAELFEQHRKDLTENVMAYKDNIEISILCDNYGINSDEVNTLDDAKSKILMEMPAKLDSVIQPLTPKEKEDLYEKALAAFRKRFDGVTFINFETYSREIVASVNKLHEDKRGRAHFLVMYRIYNAFAAPFLVRSPSPAPSLPSSMTKDDLFGEKAALRLAGCVKSPFLDQVLPEALKGAFITLEGMFELAFIAGFYTSKIRALVSCVHDMKGPAPRRYLKVALPQGADPAQVVGNLRESLGVALPPDAYSLVRKSVVKSRTAVAAAGGGDGSGNNGDNTDGMFLVLAFDKDDDYRRCMLHTTRIGESGCAVLKRCPTLHITSKKPLQTVPSILENLAMYNADILSITTQYPHPSSSSSSSAPAGSPIGDDDSSEYRITVVCATEEWTNIVAAQPALFFANWSSKDDTLSSPEDIKVAIDPVESDAYEHNLQVKNALPSPLSMFSPATLKGLTAESDIEVGYAWDSAIWLTYFKACDPADASGYLALIALTTLQFFDNRTIPVVERAPPLDLSLWAVKDARKEVRLAASGPLSWGLLVVPTADTPPAALGTLARESELVVTEEAGSSPLDAARARPGACVLVNVEDKAEEFGKGWKDGTFIRCHADEAEIMLGTALVPFLSQTYKSELRALTENIGTEAENVALVRDLLVVREGVETGYRFVEGRATVNVACSEGLITGEESFRKVVRSLLVAVAKNGLRKVVVGRLCYNEDTKRMFVDVVKSEFRGLFDEVVFASNNIYEK